MRICTLVSAAGLLSATLLGTAQGAFLVNRNGVLWDATYEGDVAPPTGSTPAWALHDTQGVGAFQASDGDIYTINTSATTAAVSYNQGTAWSGTGTARTVEIRTRVLPEAYEAGDGAAGLIMGLNSLAYDLRFHSGFVTYNINGGLNTAATLDTSQFHVYRMVVDQAANPVFKLYIDGATTPAFTSNSTWFNSSGFDILVFGDYSTGGLAGHTETDYISWAAGAFPPQEIPEPAALALLPLAGLLLRRRA